MRIVELTHTLTLTSLATERLGALRPEELPRIAAVVAELRGLEAAELALATSANALAALPRLQALINA